MSTRDDLYISFHGLLTRRPESSRAGVQVQNRHFRPLQITSSSAKQISAIFYTFHARLLFRREGLPQGGRDFPRRRILGANAQTRHC